MASPVGPTGIVRSPRVRRWADVVLLAPDELARCDVAALNLACADGLPGAEGIDAEGCLGRLDDWAAAVAGWTEQGLATTFREAPERFDHSEPLYRMYAVVVGLWHVCGVRYNPAKTGARLDDPFDLDEQFVHGAVCGPGGTCATLPVVYAAVARRLGYPVRLVTARHHLFCRWDDPDTGVRLNIEGAHSVGMSTPPDEYYRTKPGRELSAEDERTWGYLRSLTPRQELAEFVARRRIFWRQQGDYRRAIASSLVASLVDQGTCGHGRIAWALSHEWERTLVARTPPRFPKLRIVADTSRARWPGLSGEPEAGRLYYLEALESVLNDPELERRWWGPLRAGRDPLAPVPAQLTVDLTGGEPCTIQP